MKNERTKTVPLILQRLRAQYALNHIKYEGDESSPEQQQVVKEMLEFEKYPKEETITYINLTPHEIKLNTGETFPPSGKIARVSVKFDLADMVEGIPTYRKAKGDVENIPEPKNNIRYIVSGMVFEAANRRDVIAPLTGHPDVVRNEKGHIISVPGFEIYYTSSIRPSSICPPN